jgi:nucleotide-binding universal stress UspA family protein
MKNILLLAHDDAGQEARFQVALDVTRALAGHLTCLDVAVMPVLPDASYDGLTPTALLEDEIARESMNRTRLEARLAHEDVAWDWRAAIGSIAGCVDDAAALADLIVVSRRLDDFAVPDMRSAASEILLKSGKPILAVPHSAKRLDLAGRALVAWDGSVTAGAALRAAVPLLKLAKGVTIYQIDDGSFECPVKDPSDYLASYGIPAIIEWDLAIGQTAGEMLLKAVKTFHADYVVMGGFGHWRWIESLFGGVTRTMLTASPVPVFLAR